MPLTPQTKAYVDEIVASGAKHFYQMTVAEARAAMDGLKGMAGDAEDMPSEDVMLSVKDGSILVRILTPTANPRGAILFVHGGGWVVGTVDVLEDVGRQLATATGCIVVMPDYRLAPEHPFPGPVEDCIVAMNWTAARYDLPLIVAGDSAGANLAAVLAIKARDAGAPDLAAQLLVYPVADYDLGTASYNAPENQLNLVKEDMEWFWTQYVPNPSDRLHPDASPLRQANLTDLPPACVISAEYDVLRDEGEAYAEALEAAGVKTRLTRYAGETHGFLVLGKLMPGTATAMAEMGSFLDGVL